MPRNQKNSNTREDEAVDYEGADAPRVDELDEEARSPQSSKIDEDSDEEDVLDDDIAEEIDIDDLAAMEGPDA